MSRDAIRIAVVGHTNAGKTSLLRTLTRRARFGEVSDRPGTTRHVEQVALQVDGREAVSFVDTPGLEDSVSLREHLLEVAPPEATPPERIRAFLQGPEAHGMFEQEAKVLRAMLDVDAAFLVIDAREPVLPKFRAEVELLSFCAKPVLPVLNFIGHAGSREADWRALLSAYGLHSVVRFDAAAPFVGAERELYHDLGTLLNHHRQALNHIVQSLEREAGRRRDEAATLIAELAVDVAAMRRPVSAARPGEAGGAAEPSRQGERSRLDESGGSGERAAAIAALRTDVAARAQRCTDDLLALYGFREGDADEAPLPQLEGRWSMDFFSAEAAREAGLRLGKGAAIGAAVGAVADVAVAGLSLGAATAIGASIGGALSQGLGPAGRKLANLLTNVQELTVEDRVLLVLVSWQLSLVDALERRGHGATSRIRAAVGAASTDDASIGASTRPASPAPATNAPDRQPLNAVIRAARPARGHPEWESGPRGHGAASPRRQALVGEVAGVLRPMMGSGLDRPPDEVAVSPP